MIEDETITCEQYIAGKRPVKPMPRLFIETMRRVESRS